MRTSNRYIINGKWFKYIIYRRTTGVQAAKSDYFGGNRVFCCDFKVNFKHFGGTICLFYP